MKYLLTGLTLIALSVSNCAAQEVQDIPNPTKKDQWVVDLTNTLSTNEFDRINSFCKNIYSTGGTEFVVVVIPTTGNRSIEEFATALFNHWGVGSAAKNDGILFLVAKNDRKMRIELGSGIDSPEQEAIAKRILDDEVTPRFKAGEFGEGLYAGTFAAALQVLSLAENDVALDLGKPARNPLTNNFGSPDTNVPNAEADQPRPKKQIQRRKSMPIWPFVLGGGVLIGGIAIFGGRHWMRYRKRNCQRCNNELVLLTEDQDDQFLEHPETIEERIGSVDYDVWACLYCEDVNKVRYGRFFTRYSNCPKCNYKTRYEIKETIVQANYSHGGRVRVDEYCEHCPHRLTRYYSTPKLTKSSSSSGGSSGFGGGSSSGFGGGSSSGGGASGGW